MPGRAQWILFCWGQLRVGLLNIYAPNHASARATFWSQLLESLPSADSWCIGGDFNMIETPEDRCRGSQITVHGSERAAWEQLCMTMRLEDAWHHPGFSRGSRSLQFSRSDRRVGGTNLSRIDRMYISEDSGMRGGTCEILAGTCMSDYSPVMLVIHEDMRPSSFALRIPESMQTDAGLSDGIEGLWSGLTWEPGSCSQSFALGLQQESTFLRDKASRRLAEAREVERRLHCSVASLQRQVEQCPSSE